LIGAVSLEMTEPSPALSSSLWAEPKLWHRTSGTATCSAPVETKIVTVDPGSTSCPEAGSVRVTAPSGTVSLGSSVGPPGSRPRSRSAACASSTDEPSRSGIAT
jgi:hypothetical protein